MAEMWFRNVFFLCSWEGKFLGDSPLLWEMVKGIFVDLLKPKPDSKPVHPREPAGLRGGERRRLNHVAARCRIESTALAASSEAAASPRGPPPPLPYRCRLCRRRLGTGCMIKPQSSMSRHIPQFCGVLGHTFMEFLKGSGDYCQAQHDLYADE